MFKSFGVPERLLVFTVMENLAVYASCNFWLIWNPLSAVLENIGQLIFVWGINVNVCKLILNLLASNENHRSSVLVLYCFKKLLYDQ